MSHQFDLEPEFLELHQLCREQTMTSPHRCPRPLRSRSRCYRIDV